MKYPLNPAIITSPTTDIGQFVDPFDDTDYTEEELAQKEAWERRQLREVKFESAAAMAERRSAMHASGRDVMEYLGLPENEHLTARDLGYRSDSLEEGYARRRAAAERSYRNHAGYAPLPGQTDAVSELPADAADLVGLLRAAYTDVKADRTAKAAARLTGKTARRSVEKLQDALVRYADKQIPAVVRAPYVPPALKVADLNYYAARASRYYSEMAERCPGCRFELLAAWREGISRIESWVYECAVARGENEPVEFVYADWVRGMIGRAQLITSWGSKA